MEIESVPFDSFRNLTDCTHVLDDPDNHGCQWYATADRRVAGRIYLDPVAEAFRFSVLRLAGERWKVDESPQTFSEFEDAEADLHRAMRRQATGKEVTLTDVPAKIRFGKGRTRDAVSEGEPA